VIASAYEGVIRQLGRSRRSVRFEVGHVPSLNATNPRLERVVSEWELRQPEVLGSDLVDIGPKLHEVSGGDGGAHGRQRGLRVGIPKSGTGIGSCWRAVSAAPASRGAGITVMLTASAAPLPTPARESKDGPR